MISKSLHQNWNPGRPKLAQMLLIQTYLEDPTLLFWKLQLLILLSSYELTLSNYYMTLTRNNLWFYSWFWLDFFHQVLHRQLFPLKNAFLFLKSTVVCSTYQLCTALTENISVRLRVLSCFSWNCPWCAAFQICVHCRMSVCTFSLIIPK